MDIFRAWTPNRGGLPGIEEKPLNERLSYEVQVLYTALFGSPETFRATRAERVTSRAPARQDDAPSGEASVVGAPGFRLGAVAFTGLAFDFVRTGTADNTQHLGRYVGTLDFGIDDRSYRADTGELRFGWRNQVWIPDTVVATDAAYALSVVLLQLGHPSAQVSEDAEVEGWLCANSTEEAPLLTRWERCGTSGFGPEQTLDVAAIAAF